MLASPGPAEARYGCSASPVPFPPRAPVVSPFAPGEIGATADRQPPLHYVPICLRGKPLPPSPLRAAADRQRTSPCRIAGRMKRREHTGNPGGKPDRKPQRLTDHSGSDSTSYTRRRVAARNRIEFEQKHAKSAKKEEQSLPPEAGNTLSLGGLCGLLFTFSPAVVRCTCVAYPFCRCEVDFEPA